jgi:hypothetical protein
VTNLYLETMESLARNNRCPNDVLWVDSRDGRYALGWSTFAELASNVEYDSGFGAQEVATDLVVVGRGWWLDRREYDGSECWAFNTAPTPNPDALPFVKMHGGMWKTVAEYMETHKCV